MFKQWDFSKQQKSEGQDKTGLIRLQEKQLLRCTELVVGGSTVESDATRPLRALISTFLFTGQVGRMTMFVHANLLFLPPLGTICPLPVSKQQIVKNGHCSRLMIIKKTNMVT